MASKIKVEQLEHPTSGQAVDFAVAPTVAGSKLAEEGGLKTINGNSIVGSGDISVGKVLQVVTKTIQPADGGYTLINGSVNYMTQVTASITPKSATSTLVVHAEHQVRVADSYGISMKLDRDGQLVNGSNNRDDLYFFYKGSLGTLYMQPFINTSTPSASTDTTTFTLVFSPYNNTGEVSNGWGNRYISIMEVE